MLSIVVIAAGETLSEAKPQVSVCSELFVTKFEFNTVFFFTTQK